MSNISFLQYFLICIFISSCSFLGSSPDNKSEHYTIKQAPLDWKILPPGGSDHAFSNEETFSIITINSLCGRYESTSLKQLTYNILGGLDNPTLDESSSVQYNNREALRSNATAKIDGIEVFLTVKILRKNECIYDFILISTTPESRSLDTPAFDQLLSNIIIP
jgi:hypothetical protein